MSDPRFPLTPALVSAQPSAPAKKSFGTWAPGISHKLKNALAAWRSRQKNAAAASAPVAVAALLSAAKPAPLAAAAVPAPVSLVTVPSAVASALPSSPANAPQKISAVDEQMADYRHESNPARRSEIAAQLIAKRDAASQPVAFAPRASGAPAPRSTSAASALVAQMIATAEPAARADLAARVCASLQAALGTDDALARYASERDPAKRSEIAQQIIAAREHSAGQSELRALLIRFESAHSLETRAGIFHQVTIAARRCGLL